MSKTQNITLLESLGDSDRKLKREVERRRKRRKEKEEFPNCGRESGSFHVTPARFTNGQKLLDPKKQNIFGLGNIEQVVL